MIRDIRPQDTERIKAIHRAAGIDYAFPDLGNPLFVNRLVSVADDRIIAAGLHRICYETFALVDPKARPQEKWAALRELNDALSTRAWSQGLDETHASIPPIGFDRRLRQFGWEPDREGWRLWSHKTSAISGQ